MRAISASLAWANGVLGAIGGQSTRASPRRLGRPAARVAHDTPRGYDGWHDADTDTRPPTRHDRVRGRPLPPQLRQGQGAAHAAAVPDGGSGPRDRPDDR